MIRQHLRNHGIDLALGILGTAAAAVAVSGPAAVVLPALAVMAAAGAIMVRRNSDQRGEQ
jgi:ABC-type nitrate/sulfonate/bicarbonate transport system substrate-binding protein